MLPQNRKSCLVHEQFGQEYTSCRGGDVPVHVAEGGMSEPGTVRSMRGNKEYAVA
jgi:hypothetical protein